jgi:DNA-directed RNA polymerase specialized sigma24 family protein
MTMRSSVRDAMLAAVPSLRAFAISLCGNVDRADDLLQETLLRAMANIDSFQPGTNMSAWLFTILRNLFRSEYRKRRREVEDTDGTYAETLKSHPEQHSRVEFDEFRARSRSCRQTSGRRSSSSAHRASPTRRPPPSATARWERSRAASIGRAPACRTFCRLRVRTISVRTMPPAQSSRQGVAADRRVFRHRGRRRSPACRKATLEMILRKPGWALDSPYGLFVPDVA